MMMLVWWFGLVVGCGDEYVFGEAVLVSNEVVWWDVEDLRMLVLWLVSMVVIVDVVVMNVGCEYLLGGGVLCVGGCCIIQRLVSMRRRLQCMNSRDGWVLGEEWWE
mmetsp:Transcript_33222/g.40747  ORF Transcript_33222/g.40747 Transcript_33222/m.40747 type:complete len:106 (+) Transcript_33222:124-441(+)